MLPLKPRLWPRTPGRQLSNSMKIGIIGAGKVGGGLGKLWVRAGHQVLFSSRHPKRLTRKTHSLAEATSSLRAGRLLNRRCASVQEHVLK